MPHLSSLTIVVRDYDEAIEFYTKAMDFELLEDEQRSPSKRWVRLRPKGAGEYGCAILLGKAKNDEQAAYIGRQTGGRVAFLLHVEDFDAYYENLMRYDVKIARPPSVEDFGKVMVFEDLYGNLWDLIEPAPGR